MSGTRSTRSPGTVGVPERALPMIRTVTLSGCLPHPERTNMAVNTNRTADLTDFIGYQKKDHDLILNSSLATR